TLIDCFFRDAKNSVKKDFLGPFEADIRTPIGSFEDGTGFGLTAFLGFLLPSGSVAFAAKILLHPLSNQLLGDIIGKNEANVLQKGIDLRLAFHFTLQASADIANKGFGVDILAWAPIFDLSGGWFQNQRSRRPPNRNSSSERSLDQFKDGNACYER
ncbi:envelope glycoprotein gp160, partial [Striga asiatica]